jgi:hypothetical protein
MAEQQNTSSIKTNIFTKGMVKDTDPSFIPEGVWTHARNAVNNTVLGQVGDIGNEPANKYCTSAPFTVIGIVSLIEDKWVVFSTNDVDSEIGIFDESECSYKKIVRDACLNFKTSHLIKGVSRENFDCTRSVYFVDSLNPDRVLNLDRVPYIAKRKRKIGDNCYVDEYSDKLDCEALRIAPLIDSPCISLKKSDSSGTLPNGSYQVAVAYSSNGIRLTDYFLPSNIQSLFNHSNVAGAVEVGISFMDSSYDEFELVLISTISANTVARSIGFYSTRSKTILIDRLDDVSPAVSLSEIPLITPSYETSDNITEVNGYLVRTGIYTRPNFNYQPQANNIVTKWVSVNLPADYYVKGGNQTSYMRDEVYSFFIRWVYNTGDRSASYHIPGRKAIGSDNRTIGGADALESASGVVTRKWEAYDTSDITSTTQYQLPNGQGTVIAEGVMSYWESSESYPDDKPIIWGDLCGDKIRHHKFPDNCTTNINSSDGANINILGVKFENISHPLDINGNPIQSIVGYEILRGSREGNKTIIAKGILNNMGEYDLDEQITERKGLYSNYPFNDLRVDPYLSKKEVKGGCAGKGYEPMGTFKNDVFSFHSPETQFQDPFLNPFELKIHGEISGSVDGQFKPVYNHPEQKALRDAAIFTAAVIGTGIGLIAATGEKTTYNVSERVSTSGLTMTLLGASTGTLVDNGSGILGSTTDVSRKQSPVTANLAQSIATQVAGGFIFVSFLGQGMEATIKVLESLIPYNKFAYQYNAHGFYTNYTCPKQSNTRRKVLDAQYINPYLQEFGIDYRINNLFRSRIVAVRLDNEIERPSVVDDSRVTIGNLQLWKDPTRPFKRTTSAYYSSLKIKMASQYGQIDSIIQVPISSCVYATEPSKDLKITSPVLFGGDIYINRYTEKNTFFFFNDWLFGQPDGYQYDYMQHINIPYPRYWMDTTQYDYTKLIAPFAAGIGSAALSSLALERIWKRSLARTEQLLQEAKNGAALAVDPASATALGNTIKKLQDKIDRLNRRINNIQDGDSVVNPLIGAAVGAAVAFGTWKNRVLPNDYRYLDRQKSECDSQAAVGITDGYFYLFANGIRDFFVESEINLAQRDWGEELYQRFYDPYNNTDLDTLFRSDIIKSGNYFKYDYSLSASKFYVNNISWGSVLARDFDPLIENTCYNYYPNRAIYSLPQSEELKKDNWLVYLPNNYRDFDGRVTAIQSAYKTGALILFNDASPVVFPGVDQLQTDNGIKVTIGDGGLFTGNLQNIYTSDAVYEQGSCQSFYSAINTPVGLFWVSQNQGRVFNFNSGLKEISRNGMKWWFAKYLPSMLLKDFPTFELYDNPVAGVGVMLAYDNTNEILYLTKKDYKLKDEYEGKLVYKSGNTFLLGRRKIPLGDPTYFEDASFTISYDPKGNSGSGAWVSFHDWHPNMIVSSRDHFMTIKGKDVWKHNVRCDKFCNFYGKDYPFEVEYVTSTGQEVATLKNIEYQLECYKYAPNCEDVNHVLNENFDNAIIYNTEQVSGNLKLVMKQANDPLATFEYPIIRQNQIDILCSKEENKYRFNQFWDITRNRGEFTPNYETIWDTAPNGYVKEINPTYTNYTKGPLQRKKFRHYLTRVLFKKLVSDDIKMLLRISNNKLTKSFR